MLKNFLNYLFSSVYILRCAFLQQPLSISSLGYLFQLYWNGANIYIDIVFFDLYTLIETIK